MARAARPGWTKKVRYHVALAANAALFLACVVWLVHTRLPPETVPWRLGVLSVGRALSIFALIRIIRTFYDIFKEWGNW